MPLLEIPVQQPQGWTAPQQTASWGPGVSTPQPQAPDWLNQMHQQQPAQPMQTGTAAWGAGAPATPASTAPNMGQYLRGLDWSSNNTGNATKQMTQAMQQYGWTPAQVGQELGFSEQDVLRHMMNYGGSGQIGSAAGNGMQPGMAYAGGSGGFNEMTGGYGGLGSSNPFAGGMGQSIYDQTQRMLSQNLNRVNSNFVGTGYGGDRHKLAQGTAIGDATNYLQGNLANLYGGLYTGDQNRNLQRYGMDQGFYTQQRGQDLTQLGLGAQILGQGVQMPWLNANNAANIYGNFANVRGAQQDPGSDWTDYVGAGLGLAQMGRGFGWW